MTRIEELSAFIREERGVLGASPGAPLVFWDGYGLDNPYSGVGRYARCLGAALDGKVRPIVVGNGSNRLEYKGLDSFIFDPKGVKKWMAGIKAVWPQYVGSLVEEVTRGLDKTVILHGLSNFNVPIWPRKVSFRRVLTVHDLIPLLDRSGVSVSYHVQFKAILKRALSLVDAVVCVSEWTRKTLLERYPFIEPKTFVIRNGVRENRIKPDLSDAATLRHDGLQFVCVSRYEKYKNLELLVEILRYLPANSKGVVVTDGKGQRIISDLLARTSPKCELNVVTGVSDQTLHELYRSSDVYVHPSKFEGFCLPIGEAMGAGLPVVFQKGSAIGEIVSTDVGIGLEATASAEDWARAIEESSGFRSATNWSARIKFHVDNLPTWDGAAESLKVLYHNLR